MTTTSVETKARIELRNVNKSFGDHHVLQEVNLSIYPGEFVALLGASGSGKSTILRHIGGLDKDYTGEVITPEKQSVVFQEHRLVPWLKVWQNVVLGLAGSKSSLRQAALETLAEVDLATKADVWPGTLSGGQAQRVALARALVRDPQALLLDEPFGALDALTRIKAQNLVSQLWQKHKPSVLLVTHDVEEAILLADRILILQDGYIAREYYTNIDHPRPQNHPRFISLKTQLLSDLGVETP